MFDSNLTGFAVTIKSGHYLGYYGTIQAAYLTPTVKVPTLYPELTILPVVMVVVEIEGARAPCIVDLATNGDFVTVSINDCRRGN